MRFLLFSRINWKSIKATAVTALALMVFYALAQKGTTVSTDKPDAQALIEQQKALYESDNYKQFLAFSDSIIKILDRNDIRVDWYNALKWKTIAQKENGEAKVAVEQLFPVVSMQTIDDSITAKLNGLLGFAFLNCGDFELGAWYYERNLQGLLKHNCKTGIGTAYMNIGYALKLKGDYQEAKNYYLTSLNYLEAEKNLPNLSTALINLGDISRFTGDSETARTYYHRAAKVLNEDDGGLESNLGWSYLDEGLPAEALHQFKRSVQKSGQYAELARGMSTCFEKLGDTTQANQYYHLAYTLAKSAMDSAKAVYYRGAGELQRNQFQRSAQTFQYALHLYTEDVARHDLSQNPTTEEAADFWPIMMLGGKAEALRLNFSKSGNVEDFVLAEKAIHIAMNALDTFQMAMQHEMSSQDALDYVYGIYETGITLAFALDKLKPGQGYLEQAYGQAERAKSGVLKQRILEREIRQTAQIPAAILDQEKLFMSSMVYWEGINQEDSLLQVTRNLQKLRDSIENLAPALAKTRFQAQNAPLEEIRNALRQGEVLLQYFWGDDQVIVFALDRSNIQGILLGNTRDLSVLIDSLQVALTRWTDPIDQYNTIASEAYQVLYKPALKHFPDAKRIIIVPDGDLFSVPFEALVQENARFLAEDQNICYQWSGALWRQSRLKSQAGSAYYGGFAPEYNAPAALAAVMGPEVTDLPEAREAVGKAGKTWGGAVWQGAEVDKSLFLQEAGKYGVLHLAMHGVVDFSERTRTGLLFPNATGGVDILNALEISQMNLSAQVAVLSACHTASGRVRRGEGVMSLSRSFALAGCPAVVANLWSVPSAETNAIAERFMQLLYEGKAKDKALREAKKDYLAKAVSERKHPYFWAGQVLVGNEAPVQKPMGWLLAVLLGGVVGLVGVFAWWKRKQ
ncbi:MAG: CHAT domain-containing protein [Saprospiraceae bacterium]|nr:CHAT domain-containing protein [Saprospiraceae bacterium]